MSLVWSLFLGVVLAVALLYRKSYPGWCNAVLVVCAAVIFVVSVGRFLRTDRSVALAQDAIFGAAVGSVLGGEIAKDFPDGAVVAIVRPPLAEWRGLEKVYESTVRGLRRGMNGSGYSIHVVPREESLDDPFWDADYLSEAEYRALLAQVPDVDVVVLQSLVFEPNAGSRPADFPPVYIISGAEVDVRARLVDQGYVRAMVDFRTGADWNAQSARGQSDRDVFNLRYELIRPEL